MANAFGFLTSTVPSLRIKVHPSETKALLRRRAVTVCSSGIEDVGKHVSPSPAQSHKIGIDFILGAANDMLDGRLPSLCLTSLFLHGGESLLIVSLTGNESLRILGVEPARKALEMVDVDADDLDLILMCTSTPDNLFGDAPLACKAEEDGLLSFDFHSDGEGGRHLGSPIKYSQTNDLSEVFHFAARRVPQSTETALKKASLTASGINWFPSVISNLANYGNTSAASIPLELDDAVRSGKVKQGHTIAAAGFKAGLTWTSAVIRWG
ncbi:hypothetical protein V6N11_051865 [Hibiscus sabdariffa]|uniref:Beta-ketoacyl-[acyl-carrier-protein] synthase III C-terminal domain-containing protein n=1 Tax=Hibiscus sabdariffa TaxID=183260 RepID=A0ABR2U8M5_9ROSI